MKNNNWYKKEKPFATLAGMGGGATGLVNTSAAGEQVYIDNIFKSHAYIGAGNYSPTAIDTGINLVDNDGLVWIKGRDNSDRHHCLFNTLRGAEKFLRTSESAGEQNETSTLSSFNTNGFSIRNDNKVGQSNKEYISWNFVKKEKFMDTLEYTGNGVPGHQIAHNLGCTPGMIWIKKRDGNATWFVWHQNLSNTTTKYLQLNETAAETQNENPSDDPVTTVWNNTAPTDTNFTVGTNPAVNTNGSVYIVYLFAHDQQEFGESRDQSVMKMGSYTGNGSSSSGPTVNLGWEPQFLMIKNRDDSGDWVMMDTTRKWIPWGDVFRLKTNTDTQEGNDPNRLKLLTTGFRPETTDSMYNSSGDTYVYWAIRRPDGYVGKPPEAGTDSYTTDTGNGSAYPPAFDSAMGNVDIAFQKPVPGHESFRVNARHYPEYRWEVGGAQNSDSDVVWDISRGWGVDFTSSNFSWMFKRGRSMDIVNYYATGNSLTLNHGLAGTPEMVWLKGNPAGAGPGQYNIWHTDLGFSKKLEMGSSSQGQASSASSYWTAASDTTFTIGTNTQVNHPSTFTYNYHILLFRSLAGISKVATFTGDGNANRTINCGFSPRFLWFKIYDGANGPFWLFDTSRGWTTGTNGQKVIQFGNPATPSNKTDWIVPVSNGFEIVSVYPDSTHLNTDGYKFMYWAHA